jgi:hypothetical protein
MLLNFMASAVAAFGLQANPPVVVKALEPILRPMTVEVEQDPITDKVSAFAVARSADGRLAIGCDSQRFRGIRVAVRSQGWFSGRNIMTGMRIMPFRFDRQPAIKGNWLIDDDAATLYPSSQIISFLNAATAAQRLTIRTKDIEGRQKDLTFSMVGGGPAIRQMLQICAAQPRK